uniref:uncharacterized protein LOC120821900 n=1 Tax=Gasterosteus aculeatus aculeatus TaxID=481459 RepID=UPI001A982C82|nr:uncharacterized protein LOC120821900 [Gasterosteus aculeatus aculeatus]
MLGDDLSGGQINTPGVRDTDNEQTARRPAAMILTGRSLCLPSRATVQELFSVARDAGVVPDISLDPVLTTFLSLDSSAALQHQHASSRRSMSGELQAAFGLNLSRELGGSARVTGGGVGVVALALSLLFDQVAQQVRAQGSTGGNRPAPRPQPRRIFGISSASRIGRIVHSYLRLIPGIANDHEKMAEATELHDDWLNLELIDHYERMTTRKRMSSVSMQQWLAGAAFHLHVRIHQVRLKSVPRGSVESLRLSYKTALSRLVQGYTVYLHSNIKETPAGGPGQTNTLSRTNTSKCIFNSSLASDSTDTFNRTTSANSSADVSRGRETDFGLDVPKRRNETTARVVVNTECPDNATHVDVQGLLVIEPGRNVTHKVQHHPCESPALQQALVTRIINAQDLERNRHFFLYSEKFFHNLLSQKDDFELKTN